MNSQHEDLLVRLKLTLYINRLLANNHDAMYLSEVENTYYRSSTKEFVNEVVAEMEADGLIQKIKGRRGGYILVRCIQGVPLNPEPFIEDAVPRFDRDEQRKLNRVDDLLQK